MDIKPSSSEEESSEEESSDNDEKAKKAKVISTAKYINQLRNSSYLLSFWFVVVRQ